MAQMEKINLRAFPQRRTAALYFVFELEVSFSPFFLLFHNIVLAVKRTTSEKSALSKHRNLILHAGLHQRFRCASQYYFTSFSGL